MSLVAASPSLAPPETSSSCLAVTFRDNSLLTMLCGAYDHHLTHLERTLGIRITARGNTLTISGEEHLCRGVRRTLKRLYHRIETGENVSLDDVDDALRMEPATAECRAARLQLRQPESSAETISPPHNPAHQTLTTPGFITPLRRVVARSRNQRCYMRLVEENELVFALGPAGSGKTYLAVAAAVAALNGNQVRKIILSRPAVEAGERLGALPGDMRDKVDPYLRPLYDALYSMLPAARIERALESGEIEIAPLAFMRGRTFTHAFAVLDEAQNCTAMQLKMFLTRLGSNSRMIVTGDPSQTDLPAAEPIGLTHAAPLLRDIPGIAIAYLDASDIIRHELVGRIVAAYDRNSARNQ